MSELCHRGYKCFCFQCGETDCEKYEPEPPKWIDEVLKDPEPTKVNKEVFTPGAPRPDIL